MLGIETRVNLRLNGLTRTLTELGTDESELLDAIIEVVEEEYTEFTLTRFDRYSRGRGDWPPKKSDAGKKKKDREPILVRTRAMREGLEDGIGAVVSHEKRRGFTLNFTFTNEDDHPEADMTIAQLATIHDLGLGVVPRRRILAQPTTRVKARMVRRAITPVLKYLAETAVETAVTGGAGTIVL